LSLSSRASKCGRNDGFFIEVSRFRPHHEGYCAGCVVAAKSHEDPPRVDLSRMLARSRTTPFAAERRPSFKSAASYPADARHLREGPLGKL